MKINTLLLKDLFNNTSVLLNMMDTKNFNNSNEAFNNCKSSIQNIMNNNQELITAIIKQSKKII